MSLLRLLTAGKSLIGSKSSESRYHLGRPGALPRFGGKKNPFRATTRPEAAQSAATVPAQPACEGTEPAVESQVSVPEVTTKSPAGTGIATVAVGTHDATPASAPPSGKPAADSPLARYTGKLKDLMPFGRRKKPEMAVPRFSKAMVQTELSLESVRVVRNDLSDSDVEIVPAQPPVALAAENSAEGTWGKVTGRLFGAGKV